MTDPEIIQTNTVVLRNIRWCLDRISYAFEVAARNKGASDITENLLIVLSDARFKLSFTADYLDQQTQKIGGSA